MKVGKSQNPFQFPPPQYGQQPPVHRAAAPQANPFQQKFAGGNSGHPPGDHLAAFRSQIAPGGGLNINLNSPRHGDKVGGRLSVFG
jgi:hypothetical protein